jgi:hypothetical protein
LQRFVRVLTAVAALSSFGSLWFASAAAAQTGHTVYAVNATGDKLVAIEGSTVVGEVPVGHHPATVAVSPDGKRA